MVRAAGSPPSFVSTATAEQPALCPLSPSANTGDAASPRSPLSLDAAGSPCSNALQQVIVTDSPPHRQLQANACCNSMPRAPPAFLQPLAAVLQRCVDLNAAACPEQGDGSPAQQQQRTPFHGIRLPPIRIAAYLQRIAKYAKCSPVCFVMAETYLERLAEADEAMRPVPLNVHRLMLTGVLLAAKLMDDHYYNNAYYAKIGGVALDQLNSLELVMMHLLDFRLRVGALPVTQTLACITASADAPDAKLAARFGPLLRPAAAAAIVSKSAALAAAPVAAAAVVPAAYVGEQQQRRSSLDCRAAASVMPFVASSIAAH